MGNVTVTINFGTLSLINYCGWMAVNVVVT